MPTILGRPARIAVDQTTDLDSARHDSIVAGLGEGDRGEHRTAEEDVALELMVRLIQDYDEEHYSVPDPNPREMLVYLMEQPGGEAGRLSADFQIQKLRVQCR
ncbi:MAG TPA: hypothetical protein VN924_19015 [Bryobacteraceae bacterium]|nr:hypothetical protein [Bryobacteraceae bacterium]